MTRRKRSSLNFPNKPSAKPISSNSWWRNYLRKIR